MSSPPSQRQRQSSPNEVAPNPAAAAAALAAAAEMRYASRAAVVRICGTSPSECGYCKGARAKTPAEAGSSSQAYSLLGDFLTPETYEGFLYRGWRRSGTYLYKPNNWISCCPALTIRLPVKQFVPTKSQRKVAKKMDQILERQQPQQEGKRGHKRKHPSQSTEETMIEQGHVLEQLQQWTKPILQSLVQGYAATNSKLDIGNLKAEPTFKIRTPPGKKKPSSTERTSTVKVCTTICAALAGQSKGAIQRDQLSEQLTQQIKASHAGKSHPLSQSNNPLQSASSPITTWTITDVSHHAKSGQVFCDLQIQDPLQNGSNSQHLNDDASMKDATGATPDKLHQWLQEHGPSMIPFTRQPSSNNPSALQPPYPFAMETVPAHQSALDPEVHKLYFLYQNKVHQDADPFTCDLNNPLNNSNSNLNVAGAGADDANGMEEDEWSTPATSDGNDLLPQNPNGGKLSPPPPPAVTSDRNPPGFVDTAKRMLQREYPHVPADRLKQIVKSFGSFYQFLVESPFHIPTNGHRGVSATVTATPTSPTTTHVHLPAGTYHQQYRVAGMLIAVGVVDILPQGLSSVYLFYHPQFARDLVPLGKYAILQEIEFARALQLPYYYLGYYIESCTKMRYKAEYRPSELLCPTTYNWVDAKLAQRILPILAPKQHCCTLFYEDAEKLEADLKKAAEKLASKEEPSDDDVSMDDLAHPVPGLLQPPPPSPQPPQQSPAAATTTATTTNNPPRTKSILKKPNPSPFPPNPHVEKVKMDVGVGVPVTLSMLHERGRETVRPLLEEFVKEAGPQLSQNCLVKFN